MISAASPRLLVAVSLGGAMGAVLRWLVGDLAPDGAGFGWTTFAINVSGSALLAGLPAVDFVRRSAVLSAGLGAGLLGGWTTLSTYSEQARALLASGRTTTALLYLLGTLAACLLTVTLVSRLSAPAEERAFEAEGGDE